MKPPPSETAAHASSNSCFEGHQLRESKLVNLWAGGQAAFSFHGLSVRDLRHRAQISQFEFEVKLLNSSFSSLSSY